MKNIKKLLTFVLSFGVLCLFACKNPVDSSLNESSFGSSFFETESFLSESSEEKQYVAELICVSDIIHAALGTTDYLDEFNEEILDIAGEKYGVLNLVSIDIDEFSIAQEGKIVLSVVVKGAENEEPAIITYEGDTTKYETLYRLAYEKEDYIAEILAEKGLTMDSEVEKDSEVHLDLAETFAGVKNDFNSGKTAFANLSAEDFKEPEPVKPIEYVTVQSIVDEVFKDIDVDADVKETAQAIFTTRVAAGIKMNNLLAVDYDKTAGDYVIYVESESSTGAKNINSFKAENAYPLNSIYLDMSKDFDGYIARTLGEKGLNLTDQVEDGSIEESELVSYFEGIRENYETQKTAIEKTTKTNITAKGLFTIADFDTTKMSELGITSMNAFAEALLNNENGDGYDQVAGWTMDDVVATYVSDFTTESINYTSKTDILVITKNGIYNYETWTQRIYGDTTDRYSMILSDNQNVDILNTTQVVTLSDNAIVFDENGQRI